MGHPAHKRGGRSNLQPLPLPLLQNHAKEGEHAAEGGYEALLQLLAGAKLRNLGRGKLISHGIDPCTAGRGLVWALVRQAGALREEPLDEKVFIF